MSGDFFIYSGVFGVFFGSLFGLILAHLMILPVSKEILTASPLSNSLCNKTRFDACMTLKV